MIAAIATWVLVLGLGGFVGGSSIGNVSPRVVAAS